MPSQSSNITLTLRTGQKRRNLRALIQYVIILVGVIVVFTAMFQATMIHEERSYSWLTGLYWTITVMTTVGFGDVTFASDLGKLYTVAVMISGLVMLFIMLPVAIIRYLYTPSAPYKVPTDATGHVLFCSYDGFIPRLAEQLEIQGIPYYVLEPDPDVAADLHGHAVPVVTGELDSCESYLALRAKHARMIVATRSDAMNTNITLTVREVAPEVPIVAIALDREAVDILSLTGASEVLPLKDRLGEHLASRVSAGHAHTHVNGQFEDLQIAEFPVHNTPLANRTLRDTRLRELTGLNVVACWERGKLLPAGPDTVLGEFSVPVVVGTKSQMEDLDAMFVIYTANENPVIVIGGGRVGVAATRYLRERGVVVHLIERDEELRRSIEGVADRLFVGSAADRIVLVEAGIESAPSVLVTTNDDATNIYLSAFCRRLNDDLQIVSRITHDRNLEAIHRAGANYALSYDSLGTKALMSLVEDREMVILGEDVDMFRVPAPPLLSGKSLAESEIGAKTGLNVIALKHRGELSTNPTATTIIEPGSELVLLGTAEQRGRFAEVFVERRKRRRRR